MTTAQTVLTAIKSLDDVMRQLHGGPASHYLRKLCEHSEALLTRFAPLQVGDRAMIVSAVPLIGSWEYHARTLQVGAVGTIREADYSDGDFEFGWEPDEEWWTDRFGVEQRSRTTHRFTLAGKYLKKVTT